MNLRKKLQNPILEGIYIAPNEYKCLLYNNKYLCRKLEFCLFLFSIQIVMASSENFSVFQNWQKTTVENNEPKSIWVKVNICVCVVASPDVSADSAAGA